MLSRIVWLGIGEGTWSLALEKLLLLVVGCDGACGPYLLGFSISHAELLQVKVHLLCNVHLKF